ncbi:MAG: BON domain-containing protein [Chryseolinea sp.]
MKNDKELRQDVIDAIRWEPLLSATEIGVEVKDGIVTLSGMVDSYVKKAEAEDAAKHVKGVVAVVEKIEIILLESALITDNDIAAEVVRALKWNWQVPPDKVSVIVEDGWVKLEGEFDWNFQRTAAHDVASKVIGVKGVFNDIKIIPASKNTVEALEIKNAIQRNWAINGEDIFVNVAGTQVTLSGTVSSWYQKEQAELIAWKAPGVWTVENELVVILDQSLVGH